MKTRRSFRAAALLAAAIFIGSLTGCTPSCTERTAFAMGSVLTAKIYAPETQAEALFGQLTDRINALEKGISATDPDAAVYAANRDGSADADAETIQILQEITELCGKLDGAVDATLGAVTELWGFSTDTPHKPVDDEIQTALATAGLDKLLLDGSDGKIILAEGQKLDAGAFGKGAALDKAYQTLRTADYSAVISFGGSVLLFGAPRRGRSWTVGVRDPIGGENDFFATLTFTPDSKDYAGFLSTSGSYEKNFTEDGVFYHHILSAKTGYPVETDLVSVTVYAPAGLASDALSTACVVNGLNETTLCWLEDFGAEAIFVNKNKEYYVTDGMRDAFTLNDGGFTPMPYEG